MKRMIIAAAAAVAVTVAITGGAIAYASIPAPNGVIHGCYTVKGGALKVIDTSKGQKCATGQHTLNWNQKGPPGPAGSVATDYGIVQVAGNNNAPVCSFHQKNGPDSLTVAGKLITDPITGNAQDVCEISGFPSDVVPITSALFYHPAMPMQYSPGGPLDVEVGLVSNYPTLPALVFSFAIIDPPS